VKMEITADDCDAIANSLVERAFDRKLLIGPVEWEPRKWFFMVVGFSESPWVKCYGCDTSEETEQLLAGVKASLEPHGLVIGYVESELALASVAATLWPHEATRAVHGRLQAKQALWSAAPNWPC
jgi:hypothetical protein